METVPAALRSLLEAQTDPEVRELCASGKPADAVLRLCSEGMPPLFSEARREVIEQLLKKVSRKFVDIDSGVIDQYVGFALPTSTECIAMDTLVSQLMVWCLS